MAKNNKLVVFTDDMSVRKAFYGLIYNSTRTGLVADSKTLNITGVLSVTDFIMVLMMLWKFRENIDEMRGTPLSHQEFNCMDVANMRINKWKELLKVQGNLRPFVSISTNESIFRAVELLTKHRIHRLPVMDRKTNDCAYILTHRRILHYIWKHCSMLPRPNYMYEPVFDLKVGTYTGIQYATEDMTLLEALDLLIDNGISGLPIVERDTMKIVEIYTRFDAVSVAFCKAIDMSISVGEAIRQREQICGGRDGLVTAPENVSMWELVELFVEKNVHRVFLINSNHLLKGLVSLSDLINYMVLRPAHTKQNSTLNVC